MEQVSQMIFDEKKLEELRGKGADFKESFDMGMSPPAAVLRVKAVRPRRTALISGWRTGTYPASELTAWSLWDTVGNFR